MDSKVVRVVFIALLLDILAFTVILPLLPRLLQFYRLQEAGDEVSEVSMNHYLAIQSTANLTLYKVHYIRAFVSCCQPIQVSYI